MAWMTIRDAVGFLDNRVSYGSVRRLAVSGKVKATRVGGRILICGAALKEYLVNEGYRIIAPRNNGRGNN